VLDYARGRADSFEGFCDERTASSGDHSITASRRRTKLTDTGFAGTIVFGYKQWTADHEPTMLIKHPDRGDVLIDLVGVQPAQAGMLKQLRSGMEVQVSGSPTDITSKGRPVFKATGLQVKDAGGKFQTVLGHGATTFTLPQPELDTDFLESLTALQ
jgi:hypothetical protein